MAAFAVLVSHSYALSAPGTEEPLAHALGVSFGSTAVDIFFLTSGFLVTASLLSRQNIAKFVRARILRIFPAMLVMLLITITWLGMFFSTEPLSSYFSSPQTLKYFLKCLTLFSGVEYELPGVFTNNPYKNAVNGSLWTMPYEVKMYAILAIIWSALFFIQSSRAQLFKLLVLVCTGISCLWFILAHFGVMKDAGFGLRLFFMFFSGASFYVLKGRIILSRQFFYFFLALLLFSSFSKDVFFIVYNLTLAYLLFAVAYIPAGMIRTYNKLGDYSYGAYIYAFPVQQSTVALMPGISVGYLMLISSTITLALAMLSWHLLEKHALKLK